MNTTTFAYVGLKKGGEKETLFFMRGADALLRKEEINLPSKPNAISLWFSATGF